MPKGRRSNERRRNRRLAGRHPRTDEAAAAISEAGHAKLLNLFERAKTTQKARRKAVKKLRKATAKAG